MELLGESINYVRVVRVMESSNSPEDIFLAKGGTVTDIQEKDKNRSQNDKTEHENEKTVKLKSQSQISQVILQSLGNDCVAKHPWGPKVEFKRKSQDDLRAKIDAYSSLLSSHTRKPAKDLEASILSYK
ncbi:hypothetical protein Tco_0820127 [Tanacetum coccineum]|uniref:Uncharacterized protein n=1 Tax=Tanacetum coccineum TaxID=301880 RepID=A0ABQ5A9I8_9ASTR